MEGRMQGGLGALLCCDGCSGEPQLLSSDSASANVLVCLPVGRCPKRPESGAVLAVMLKVAQQERQECCWHGDCLGEDLTLLKDASSLSL